MWSRLKESLEIDKYDLKVAQRSTESESGSWNRGRESLELTASLRSLVFR